MSDLERAQEWLGCAPISIQRRGGYAHGCKKHGPLREGNVWTDTWPCHEATRLAALLAEVRRQALDDAARWLAEAVEEWAPAGRREEKA